MQADLRKTPVVPETVKTAAAGHTVVNLLLGQVVAQAVRQIVDRIADMG
jgi:hypothetical protein